MSPTLTEQVRDALATFSSASRLYDLTVNNAELAGELMVEAFAADDGLQALGHRDVIVLGTSAHLNLAGLLGKQARLDISLANRNRSAFHGVITRAASLGSNGSLTRYRLRLSPWLSQLSLVRHSRVWENRTIIEIVDSVLQPYAHAQWRWSDDVGPFMADAAARSYCCQYRESDLDFIRRVLTEEGLTWRFEDTDEYQQMVLFADSTQPGAVPEDASSEAAGGIRYHGARSGENSDTVQSLTTGRSLISSHSTLLSYDYKSKKIIATSVATRQQGGTNLPVLEHYEAPGQYAFTNVRQARRYAVMYAEALEARGARWSMRSTVRTLRAGTRFTLLNGPFARDGATPSYVALQVCSVGVNNLPARAGAALAELFGPLPELLKEALPQAGDEMLAQAVAQAQATGYANWFDAISATTPWRALHLDDAGDETFSQAAVTHQSVGLGAHLGAAKRNSSVLSDKAAPLAATLEALSGMLSSADLEAALQDGKAKAVAPTEGKLPHSTDPLIAITARGGLGISSGQSTQLASGETVVVISGQDTEYISGGQLRLHTGQAIGMLAGAVAPGEGGVGTELIAAQGAVDLQ